MWPLCYSVFCKLSIVDEQLIGIKRKLERENAKETIEKVLKLAKKKKTFEQLFNTVTLAGTKSHNETL